MQPVCGTVDNTCIFSGSDIKSCVVRQLSSWNPCAWLCSVRGVWWVRPVLLLVLLHAWLPSWVSASPSIVPHSPVCNEDQPWKIMLRFLFFIYYQKDFVLGSFSILYQSQIQTLAVWNTYNGVNLVEACIYTHTYWGHSLKPWHFFFCHPTEKVMRGIKWLSKQMSYWNTSSVFNY